MVSTFVIFIQLVLILIEDIYVSTGGFIEKVLSSSNGNREVMQ